MGNMYHKKRIVTSYGELVGALDELDEGGIIELMPADYVGDIEITKDIAIIGHSIGQTRIMGNVKIDTTEDYHTVELSGFKIEAPDDTECITVDNVGELILRNMEITGSIASAEIVDFNKGVLIAEFTTFYNKSATSPASIDFTGSDGAATLPNMLVNCALLGDVDYADKYTIITGILLPAVYSASNTTNVKAPAGTDSTGYFTNF